MMMNSGSRSLLPAGLALLLPMIVAASVCCVAPTPCVAQVNIDVSVGVAPPELPVYDQPPMPGDGYLWTPGYWAWSDDIQDYYWVPGTWVEAPEPDYLWTPGYWGVEGGLFLWHGGYWGPQVGFYGGVNYGYGYGGDGYEGGYWRGGRLYYNRTVNNLGNVRIDNVYEHNVTNVTVNHISYNGGNGIHAQPTAAQLAVAHENHIGATAMQRQHEAAAHADPSLRLSRNQGRPPIAATSRAGAFTGAGVVGARHSGTLSVVHSNSAEHGNSGQRGAAPGQSAADTRGVQRNEPSRQIQPQEQRREAQPRPTAPAAQRQPPQELRQPPQEQRSQAPPRENPPQEQRRPEVRPSAPRPAEHAGERPAEHQEQR